MTAKNRTDLKALLEDGDTFSESTAIDVVDSFVNLTDTTAQTISSDLHSPRFVATTEVSSPLVRTTTASIESVYANTGVFTPSLVATTEVSSPLARVTTVSASALHGDSGTIGSHIINASALTLNVPTTGAGAAAASASTFLRITANGVVYHIPACVSV